MITNSAAIIDEGGRDEEEEAKKELQLEKKIAIATDGMPKEGIEDLKNIVEQRIESIRRDIDNERLWQ
jgi:hypothetical protein